MVNEDNNGFTEAEKAILKIRFEEIENGQATLRDLDSVIESFGLDPIALRAEAEAEYNASAVASRIASLEDGSVQAISFAELLEHTGFTEEDLDVSHGICRGLIHTDPDEIPHQLGYSLSTRTADNGTAK